MWLDMFGKLPPEYDDATALLNKPFNEDELGKCLFGNTWQAYSNASSEALDQQLRNAILAKEPTESLINLIKQGANPTSALYTAVKNSDSIEYIALLLDHGANPNMVSSKTSIFEYSLIKNPLFSKLLLQYGAKPTWTVWKSACVFNCQAVIPLIHYGMSPDTILDDENNSALIKISVKQTVQHLPEIIESLLRFGANPNHVNKKGQSALITNLQKGAPSYQLAIVNTLLAYGSNPNIRDHEGKEALNYAKTPELKRLIEAGMEDYECLICMEHENKKLKLIPCLNKHLGTFICDLCRAIVKAQTNECPLCKNQLS